MSNRSILRYSSVSEKIMINTKSPARKGKRISWISFLILDKDLHKTTQLEFLQNLSQMGHTTSLFGIYSKKKFCIKTKGVTVNSIPLRYVSMLTSVLYTALMLVYLPFYSILSKQDFIIVEPREPTFLCVFSLLLFPKSVRPKIIMDARSTPVSGGLVEDALFTFAMKTSKTLLDGITIVTPMMRKEVCDKFNIDPNTVGVWTNGATPNLFNPENYDKTALKKEFGLENRFVVFYHGSLGVTPFYGQLRGVADTIKSLALLKDKIPNLTLFMLGSSAAFPWIKKLSKEIGVEDLILLHEQVDHEEVPKYIMLGDVALVPLPDIPTWRNQCALKLLEYLAMEKVVVATDIPCNRFLLGDCTSGVYVPSSKPRDLADGISFVYEKRANLDDWGKPGRKIITDKRTWRNSAEDFEKYILAL
jgi:glycosyltransferase involved in cell wall biosynthesis